MSWTEELAGVDGAEYRAVSVGSFDGVHRGHRRILSTLIATAEKRKLTPTVLTFDPHPRVVLQGREPSLLTTLEERAEKCLEMGIGQVLILPFTSELARLSPRRFVEEILVKELKVRAMVIGHDHRFGQGASGDEQLLRGLGREFGFSVESVDAESLGSETVSSSLIRHLIQSGNVGRAAEMMMSPFRLTGTVVHGDGRGKKIGFPTANLQIASTDKVVPGNGVYAVYVEHSGVHYSGMMNIGTRPTFKGEGRHLEVHVFDLAQNLYGDELRVEFVEWIRNEREFESVDALVTQLKADELRCRAALKTLN